MNPDPYGKPANSTHAAESPAVDLLTLAAIALVVYTVSSILHEAVGHGLTRVVLGGKVARIASTICLYSGPALSDGAERAVAAGGTVVNLMAAILFATLLIRLQHWRPWSRYFLWLSMTVNGLLGAGYLAVPTLIGFGDWMSVLKGLSPYWFWRSLFIATGVVLYVAMIFLAARLLEPFLSRNGPERRRRAVALTLIPYLIGGLAFCAAGLFNPVGLSLVVISAAAASFGGAAALSWMGYWIGGRPPRNQTPACAVPLERSWFWIGCGGAAAMVLAALGRGIQFNP